MILYNSCIHYPAFLKANGYFIPSPIARYAMSLKDEEFVKIIKMTATYAISGTESDAPIFELIRAIVDDDLERIRKDGEANQ